MAERPSDPQSETPLAIPFAVWVAAQTGALLLSALRVPLWATAPDNGELLALSMLLIVQVLVAPLLAPSLASSWRSTLAALVCTWPFTILAGILAAGGSATILVAGGYATAWIISLWALQLPWKTTAARMRVAAVTATWPLAGVVLLFIQSEYGSTPRSTHFIAQALCGPLLHALGLVNPNADQTLMPWILLGILAGFSGGAKWGILIVRSRRRHQRA